MESFVYILQDAGGRYYIGSTDNLRRRLNAHRAGYTQTTRNMNSPRLVFNQTFSSLKEARSMEKWLKGLKRKDYIAKIISDGRIRKKLHPSFNG